MEVAQDALVPGEAVGRSCKFRQAPIETLIHKGSVEVRVAAPVGTRHQVKHEVPFGFQWQASFSSKHERPLRCIHKLLVSNGRQRRAIAPERIQDHEQALSRQLEGADCAPPSLLQWDRTACTTYSSKVAVSAPLVASSHCPGLPSVCTVRSCSL